MNYLDFDRHLIGQRNVEMLKEERTERQEEVSRTMKENGRDEGLLVKAEPLGLAEEISRRMVRVERTVDGALLLDADPAWAGAINTVLVKKGVRVNELSARQPERSAA